MRPRQLSDGLSPPRPPPKAQAGRKANSRTFPQKQKCPSADAHQSPEMTPRPAAGLWVNAAVPTVDAIHGQRATHQRRAPGLALQPEHSRRGKALRGQLGMARVRPGEAGYKACGWGVLGVTDVPCLGGCTQVPKLTTPHAVSHACILLPVNSSQKS